MTARIAPVPTPSTGNVLPLLNEIGHALDRLVDSGTPTVIDLNRLPMAPQDSAALDAALGTGEVSAVITAQGRSEVCETGFPGVWRVTHFSEAGSPVARFVEVTALPDILAADPGDMAAGRARLARRLDLLRRTEASR